MSLEHLYIIIIDAPSQVKRTKRGRTDNEAGVNILHKWVKLFPDGHFQAHKLFPEIMRKSRLFTGYFTFILRKFWLFFKASPALSLADFPQFFT